MPTPGSASPYPPLSDYAFLSDCQSAALVSRAGSIDWCCMPRPDAPSSFGRLLDWRRGGHCSIEPAARRFGATRRYVEDGLVLETRFDGADGEATVTDCFTLRRGDALDPHRQLVRVVEGRRGHLRLRLRVTPRFDYGAVRPWIRKEAPSLYRAIGSDTALAVWSDAELEPSDYELVADLAVRPGERVRLSIEF